MIKILIVWLLKQKLIEIFIALLDNYGISKFLNKANEWEIVIRGRVGSARGKEGEQC